MSKKVLVACLVVLSLAAMSALAPGAGSEAEACVRCNDGRCERGGDGIWCKEMHWSNGSSVCEYMDGCAY
ncbi:MAG TPA: hypothetical protein VJG13_14955 [Thermoanaerobaculia bacterium]|nr:hypothetical protein [Thermoanaerobaculia bacterium]